VAAPHNDYLRLGYELGIVGLVFYVGLVLWQLWWLARLVRTNEGVVRQAAAAAWMGWAAFLIVAVSDNPLMYTLCFMTPIFVLAGAANSVARQAGPATSTVAAPAPEPAWSPIGARPSGSAPWGVYS
jgi:O-antigen ligase